VKMNICSKYDITNGIICLWKIKIKLWRNLNNLDKILSDFWNKHLIINDNQNHIHDVVFVERNVDVLPFGAILAYAIVPNSPIKLNGPMTTNVYDVRFKCKIWLDNHKYFKK